MTFEKLDKRVQELSAEQLLHYLVQDVKCYAVIMFDPQGIVTYWNRGAETLFGYSPAEIVGRHFRTLFTPEDQSLEVPEKELHEALQTGKANNDRWLQKKDGSYFWATGVSTPLASEIGFSKLIRDETTRKKTEDELGKAHGQLKQFAATASHDLREPLRMVSTYVQLLRREYVAQLDPQANQFIDYAVDGVKRMDALIRNLMAYTSAGKSKPEIELVDPNVIVDTVIGYMKLRIDETQARISRSILPNVPTVATELSEVFQNLLSNALKYQQAGVAPVVHIDSSILENEVIFCVRDNGIGIAPENQEKVFEEFHRVSPRSEFPGTGLGLSICKNIIERHGGRIWVKSGLGEGSTFFFSIPASPMAIR